MSCRSIADASAADQILDSLAHYCHKLTALNNDSAH
ncbi:hypothetical protein ABIA39_001819 [Nocardia sp. GAS34]